MSNRQLSPVARELIAAKKRIENIENWCQGRTANGHQRCAFGAIDSMARLYARLEAVSWEVFDCGPIHVNDDLGHAATLQMFDHAISRALAEGK